MIITVMINQTIPTQQQDITNQPPINAANVNVEKVPTPEIPKVDQPGQPQQNTSAPVVTAPAVQQTRIWDPASKAIWEPYSKSIGEPFQISMPKSSDDASLNVFWTKTDQFWEKKWEFIQQRNDLLAKWLIAKTPQISNMSDAQIRESVRSDLIKRWIDMEDPQVKQNLENTISNITGNIRQQQPQLSSDDYYAQLQQWKTLQDVNNVNARQAQNRMDLVNKFAAMPASQIWVSIAKGDIIPWSQLRNDLAARGMSTQLQQAQAVAKFKQKQALMMKGYDAINVDKTKSLESQSKPLAEQKTVPNAVTTNALQNVPQSSYELYQQMLVNNPDIVNATKELNNISTEMNAKKRDLQNLEDDIRAQAIANWTVVTSSYLAALVAEKSKPMIRELEYLQDSYNWKASVLDQLTQKAKMWFEAFQQDRSFKMQQDQFNYQKQADARDFWFKQQQANFDNQMRQLQFEAGNNEMTTDSEGRPVMMNKLTGKSSYLMMPNQVIWSDGTPVNFAELAGKDRLTQTNWFIEFAKNNDMQPYKWWAKWQWTSGKGIDCSGLFTAYWLATWMLNPQQAKSMNAANMYRMQQSKWLAKPISQSQEWDMIFYDGDKKWPNWEKVQHVGMVLRNNWDWSYEILDSSVEGWWVSTRTIYTKWDRLVNSKGKDAWFTLRAGADFGTMVWSTKQEWWWFFVASPQEKPFGIWPLTEQWMQKYRDRDLNNFNALWAKQNTQENWVKPQPEYNQSKVWVYEKILAWQKPQWYSQQQLKQLQKEADAYSIDNPKLSSFDQKLLDNYIKQIDSVQKDYWESKAKLDSISQVINNPKVSWKELDTAIKSFVSAIDNTAAMQGEVNAIKQAGMNLYDKVANDLAYYGDWTPPKSVIDKVIQVVKSFSSWLDTWYNNSIRRTQEQVERWGVMAPYAKKFDAFYTQWYANQKSLYTASDEEILNYLNQ